MPCATSRGSLSEIFQKKINSEMVATKDEENKNAAAGGAGSAGPVPCLEVRVELDALLENIWHRQDDFTHVPALADRLDDFGWRVPSFDLKRRGCKNKRPREIERCTLPISRGGKSRLACLRT